MTKSRDSELSMDLGIVRPGKSPHGSKTVDKILQAAVDVLIEEGYAAFTLQRVAAKCDMKIGNVTRHFPKREVLVQILLQDILTSGDKLLKKNVYKPKISAEDALALIITGTMEGARTKGTTHLMTELWAMSNHNDFVAQRLESLYGHVHTLIGSFVKQLNASLSADDAEALAVFINATMEGATVLAGYGKPWEPRMPFMKAMAAHSLIAMVKTITPDDIQRLISRSLYATASDISSDVELLPE